MFDADALRAAVGGGASPEVVIHELTALPDRMDFRKKDLYDAHQPASEPRGRGI